LRAAVEIELDVYSPFRGESVYFYLMSDEPFESIMDHISDEFELNGFTLYIGNQEIFPEDTPEDLDIQDGAYLELDDEAGPYY
jgi:hypothetical protein